MRISALETPPLPSTTRCLHWAHYWLCLIDSLKNSILGFSPTLNTELELLIRGMIASSIFFINVNPKQKLISKTFQYALIHFVFVSKPKSAYYECRLLFCFLSPLCCYENTSCCVFSIRSDSFSNGAQLSGFLDVDTMTVKPPVT